MQLGSANRETFVRFFGPSCEGAEICSSLSFTQLDTLQHFQHSPFFFDFCSIGSCQRKEVQAGALQALCLLPTWNRKKVIGTDLFQMYYVPPRCMQSATQCHIQRKRAWEMGVTQDIVLLQWLHLQASKNVLNF